ncbi:unnamed protein product [Rotaria magnacalcarata]|uniref:26S proteasome non-ATPase regulatory subunit 9 n=1 Tax=Rotaria magnacalcarata TaxID=392030 RepID=A0A816PX37_9BILA|nr:unnamed protein product [Rotaria magnacalcarata]CAF2053681.1 unnamed protein product [Rotaria magnacalcarata]CAF3723881.1 unnamed protein product [Rotaria magnacalcarata]CAF4063048.1 unnamed protein product [Rotaria magnacalcarata]
MNREVLLELIKQKDDIEKELLELGNELKLQNNVGMTGELVDREGYPRNDIDLVRVRQIRQRVICLQNDHKTLMKQIEDGLIQVHENTIKNPSNTTDAITTAPPNNTNLPNKEPFLRVDIVSKQSPAELADLHVGDLICRIGTIRKDNFRTMQDVAALVNNSENRSITLFVERVNTKEQQTLTLTPKKWSGNGLLGCKLTPLS